MCTIKLNSRHNNVDTRYIPINCNSGILISDGNYVRHIMSKDNKSLEAIDFEGGPMVSIGYTIEDKKVKNIKTCYYVELE